MISADALIGAAGSVAHEALLFAAIGFLIGGLDDLAIDGIWIARQLRRRLRGAGMTRVIASNLPQPRERYALFVAAWDEGAVIGPMLSTLLARVGRSDVTVFVGIYANDPATIDAVVPLARIDRRIRLVVNPRLGPTTKADNLNVMWQDLLRCEATVGRQFRAVVFHDAEDLVDPHELRVFEHELARADVVQLPVLPLIDRGSRWISGHYCDEFAEAHTKMMVVREAIGAALPLAGTGFALDRDLLGRLAQARGGRPFDAESLTEDYELGLALGSAGARAVFTRVMAAPGGPLVAVRAHFPATLGAAVRQKARWMTGIALTGWDRTGWSRRASDWRENWMRLRDRRALLAVVVMATGYTGTLALLAAIGLAAAFNRAAPSIGLPVWLMAATGALMAWRLALRAAIVASAYGWCEGVRSVPRAAVANGVAMLAAIRAVMRYHRQLRGGAAQWEKTGHVFPQGIAA